MDIEIKWNKDTLKEIEEISKNGVMLKGSEVIGNIVINSLPDIYEHGNKHGWPVVFGLVTNEAGFTQSLMASTDEDLSGFNVIGDYISITEDMTQEQIINKLSSIEVKD